MRRLPNISVLDSRTPPIGESQADFQRRPCTAAPRKPHPDPPNPPARGCPWTCQPISRTPPPPGLHSARFVAIGSDPRPLELDLQRGVEREPKGLVWCLTHWGRTSAASSSRPNPHQQKRSTHPYALQHIVKSDTQVQ